MSRAFERARATVGTANDFHFALSGVPTRLRVAGDALRQRLIRPFRHLADVNPASSEPGLRIDLWDETETGVGCDGCDVDESMSTWGEWMCSADGRLLVHRRRTAFEIYDRLEQRILGWSVGPLQVSHHERGRPLLRLLMQWHRDNDRHVVHGGLLETHGLGILLVGKSGSGKSTVALASALEGVTFLSEDFLAVKRNGSSFNGYSIFGSAKLHPDHLERFPRLSAVALGPEHAEDDKSLVFLEDLPGASLAREVRVGVVVVPRVTDRPSCRAVRIGAGEALMHLAPSTLVLLNCYGLGLRRGEVVAKSLADFGALLDTCPSYRLELGRDLDSIAPTLAQIAAEVQAHLLRH